MAYCSFCTCSGCVTGFMGLVSQSNEDCGVMDFSHAQCEDGRWICETCYAYEVCLEAGSADPCDGECARNECVHRPKLVSEWTSWHWWEPVKQGNQTRLLK